MDEETITDKEMLKAIKSLHSSVEILHNLYDKDSSLNDRFDISVIIPMSLDEWEAELMCWICDERKMEKDNGER